MSSKMSNKTLIAAFILLSALFVTIGVVWLSYSAETLYAVAQLFGVSERGMWNPPMPGYEMPGLEGHNLADIIIGLGFVLVILVVTFAVGKFLVLTRGRT